jgi:peptidyl-tRNA hydrolase
VAVYEKHFLYADNFTRWFAGSYRKVVLRAKDAEWGILMREFYGSNGNDAPVAALPPRYKSRCEKFLTKLQVYSAKPGDLPQTLVDPPDLSARTMVVAINPSLDMSVGKAMAQVAHGVIMSATADRLGADDIWKERVYSWWNDGSCVHVVHPTPEGWARLFGLDHGVVVTDAGLTEIPGGSQTVFVSRPVDGDELTNIIRTAEG